MKSQATRLVMAGLMAGQKMPGYRPFLRPPGLVALWSMESSDPLRDRSGNGRTLAKNGTPVFARTAQGGTYLDKVAADYYNAIDAAWNSITGALFIAGWVQHDTSATAQETYLAKWTPTGNQRCYVLRRDATGKLNFTITSNGSTSYGVTSDGAYTTSWTFVAGLFTPSVGISTWINTTKKSYTTTPPASIFDGSGAIELGTWNGGTNGMVGNMGVFGLYNAAPTDQQVTDLYNATSRYYANP